MTLIWIEQREVWFLPDYVFAKVLSWIFGHFSFNCSCVEFYCFFCRYATLKIRVSFTQIASLNIIFPVKVYRSINEYFGLHIFLYVYFFKLHLITCFFIAKVSAIFSVFIFLTRGFFLLCFFFAANLSIDFLVDCVINFNCYYGLCCTYIHIELHSL